MDAGERKIYICVRRRTWFIKITISYNCVLDIKVAETAKNPKTAPKPSQKAGKDLAKSS